MRLLVTTVFFTALVATPALAQGTPPAQQQAPHPHSMQQPGQAQQFDFMERQQQGEWSAEFLIGSNVYDRQDNDLGTVNDIILTNQGQVAAVVIGVGGFLGLGQKDVAVEFGALQIEPVVAGTGLLGTPQQDSPPAAQRDAAGDRGTAASPDRRIYLDVTREQLENAPEYVRLESQTGVFGGSGSAR